MAQMVHATAHPFKRCLECNASLLAGVRGAEQRGRTAAVETAMMTALKMTTNSRSEGRSGTSVRKTRWSASGMPASVYDSLSCGVRLAAWQKVEDPSEYTQAPCQHIAATSVPACALTASISIANLTHQRANGHTRCL
jgi:hypothetical protein